MTHITRDAKAFWPKDFWNSPKGSISSSHPIVEAFSIIVCNNSAACDDDGPLFLITVMIDDAKWAQESATIVLSSSE